MMVKTPAPAVVLFRFNIPHCVVYMSLFSFFGVMLFGALLFLFGDEVYVCFVK